MLRLFAAGLRDDVRFLVACSERFVSVRRGSPHRWRFAECAVRGMSTVSESGGRFVPPTGHEGPTR